MISSAWQMLDQLDRKQNSLLATIALCCFSGAVMLTVGIYKGESQAATEVSEPQSVTALKPFSPLSDTDKDPLGSLGNQIEDDFLTEADWQLVEATRFVLGRRKVAAKHRPPSEESDHRLRAVIAELVAYGEELRQTFREQEASEESKDATPKDVGNSG